MSRNRVILKVTCEWHADNDREVDARNEALAEEIKSRIAVILTEPRYEALGPWVDIDD